MSYIGQTVRSVKHRWRDHCNPNSECSCLSNAIKKYGKDTFIIETIAEYGNMTDLNNAEKYYIDYYNSIRPNGYNLESGGHNKRLNEETKSKLRQSHLGTKSIWYGKLHTEETKKKISTAQLGMKNHNYGKKLSEETRVKIADALMGPNNPRYGKHHSPETCEKMKQAWVLRKSRK